MNNQRYSSSALSSVERTYSKVIDSARLNRNIAWRLKMAVQQKAIAEKLLKDTTLLNRCPICQDSRFELFLESYGYPYCECNNCGHIFCKTPPSTQSVKELYTLSDGEYKSIQAELYVGKELFEKRVTDIAAPKVQYVTKRVPKKGRWVDIGCGTGEILYAAKDQGWDVFGIESDSGEVSFAREMGLEIEQIFIEPKNVEKYVKNAAVVSLINILEHLLDPETLVKAVAESISPETRIVIEIPRHPSLSAFANKIFPDMAVRHIHAPDHQHIFTEKSIDILFKRSGLLPESIWLFGQDFYEIIACMATLTECENTIFFKEILRAVCSTQEAIDKNDLADQAIIIFKKN